MTQLMSTGTSYRVPGKARSLAHTLFIQGYPGPFTCFSIEPEYKETPSFMSQVIDKQLSFCTWRLILKILELPTRDLNPGPS